jgi:hypothetical protein
VPTTFAAIDTRIRPVRDDELKAFRENGWALLEGLLEPSLADELMQRVESVRTPATTKAFATSLQPSEVDELFHDVVFSAQMGQNALNLIRATVPSDVRSVKYWTDNVYVKYPEGSGASDTATDHHQDFQVARGAFEDRVAKVTFWIALNDLPAERSTLRFYSGSHKLGVLGPRALKDGRSIIEDYPRLEEWCPLSPPLHLKPGDATIHHSLVVHGSGPNSTSEPRTALSVVYIHSDACYNGVVPPEFAYGQAPVELVSGEPFAKPVVYDED